MVLTCTTIPDPLDASRCMLQIARVEKERIEVDKERLRQQMETGLPGLTLTFKTDVPGVHAAVAANEHILPILMDHIPHTSPPYVALL